MKLALRTIVLLLSVQLWTVAQTYPVPLRSHVVNQITTSATVIQNNSSLYRNTYHTFCATGSGAWSVTIQYADGTPSSWTNFSNLLAAVSNASQDCGGIGEGYHDFIRFSFTGTASVSYAGTNNIYLPLGGGGGSSGSFVYCAGSSSATAQTCSTTPLLPSLGIGTSITFLPGAANTGSFTLSVNGSSPIPVVAGNASSSALVANDLLNICCYTLLYNGTSLVKIAGPDGAWTSLSYVNSWADLGGGYLAGAYKKFYNGQVCLHGALALGTHTAGAQIGSVPAGYFPPLTVLSEGNTNNNNTQRIEILNTGVINLAGAGTPTGYLSIEGICWSVY